MNEEEFLLLLGEALGRKHMELYGGLWRKRFRSKPEISGDFFAQLAIDQDVQAAWICQRANCLWKGLAEGRL